MLSFVSLSMPLIKVMGIFVSGECKKDLRSLSSSAVRGVFSDV